MTVVPVRQCEVTAGHPSWQVNDDQRVTVAGNTKATASSRRQRSWSWRPGYGGASTNSSRGMPDRSPMPG